LSFIGTSTILSESGKKSNSCYDCAWIGGDWCEQERKQVEIPKKAKYNKNTEKQRREVFE
ncbi:hypothetical protein, partial [Mediterraneibacter gnavus]|uniref:hypothetical protein n=1 Tax=Mediterraneibacter gnavus TaxID=33038 RepID=UPI004068312A